MSDPNALLEIDLPGPWPLSYAGEWLPLALALKRPEGGGKDIMLKNLHCRDKEVQLDTDLFQNDLVIRPGETYLLTVPIRVAHPKTVELDKIAIQLGQDPDPRHDELVFLPAKAVCFRPAIRKEIVVKVKPLCAHEGGTKVDVTVKHCGQTTFQDLTITLGPETAIRAGKRVVRLASFEPNDKEEHIEVVVAGEVLKVGLTAKVDGAETAGRWTKKIRQPSSRSRHRFRFLEARRLSTDEQFVYAVTENEDRPVVAAGGAYPLRGAERYQIVIRPKDPGVTAVHLRDVPGILHVRNSEAADGSWKFLVDVIFAERFTKGERLFYDVSSADGPLKGEIALALMPAWGKHFQLACALGIAVTLQGFGALVRLMVKSDVSVTDALEHFHIANDYQLLFPFCIPLIWAGLLLFDRVRYRLAN
jgi:hypothetical protein